MLKRFSKPLILYMKFQVILWYVQITHLDGNMYAFFCSDSILFLTILSMKQVRSRVCEIRCVEMLIVIGGFVELTL
jgi:hypothetical protein